MRKVRSIFDRGHLNAGTDSRDTSRRFAHFPRRKAAAKSLADLGKNTGGFHVGARTRNVLRNLRPLLFKWLKRVADPDATLNQLIRFVEAYASAACFSSWLVENPKLFELLIKTFDASRYAGDLLIRRPQLLEDITRGGVLDREISVAGTFKDGIEKLEGHTDLSRFASDLSTRRSSSDLVARRPSTNRSRDALC
jgi:glutamine synthetase adenylyltransferase